MEKSLPESLRCPSWWWKTQLKKKSAIQSGQFEQASAHMIKMGDHMERKKPYSIHFIPNGKDPHEAIKALAKTALQKVLDNNNATAYNLEEIVNKYVSNVIGIQAHKSILNAYVSLRDTDGGDPFRDITNHAIRQHTLVTILTCWLSKNFGGMTKTFPRTPLLKRWRLHAFGNNLLTKSFYHKT